VSASLEPSGPIRVQREEEVPVTLRARLTAAFLAIVLGPVLVGAILVGFVATSFAAERARDRLEVGSNAVVTTVSALCQQARAAAQVVATASNGGSRTAAVRQVVSQGLADAARLEDPAGRVRASAGVLQKPGPVAAAGAGTTAPVRPWTDCTSKPAATGTMPAGITAGVELRRPDGRLVGRARAGFSVDQRLVNRLSDTSGVEVTVLDGNRWAVTSLSKPAAPDRVARAAATIRSPRDMQNLGSDLVLRVVPPMPGEPLRLALTTGRPMLQGLYATLCLAVIAAGVLAVVLAWRLARATTLPLAEVARASERVADGDLDARVPVRGRDEVGRLASTFNRMTREMQAYVSALTASRDQLRGNLALLGDTLSSTHNLDRILEVILETVMAATGAQAGTVLLVERGEKSWPGVLVGQASHGLPVPDGGLRLRIGEGLLGGVAASGEPRRGRVGENGVALVPGEPTCRTFIAVPFSGSGQAGYDEAGLPPSGRLLGVLALYDRLGADDFDDSDLVTLRTFAGQAAVAVENVLLHREAERLSLTDPLTGLWNYRYLQVSMHREIERAVRFDRPLAVLALDLDRFKAVNGRHGYAAGDVVLAEVARRLQAEVREVDLVFRQGGEEFVLLLPETDLDGAERAAERICRALRDTPVRLAADDPGVTDLVAVITASVGVAVYPLHGSTGPEVMEAADDALYAAKADGRDTWRTSERRRTR
jgi:diguanylate cyclase (GGDEF)-like protein